jgi:hypothetical protein
MASEKIVFPDTFTAYQLFQAGDQACSRCAGMLGDAKFRRNCWVMQGEKWRKIDDVLSFLAGMPQPPFVLYLTLQKRKHGWILAVQNPVLNCDFFTLIVDEIKVHFERERFNQFCSDVSELMGRGVPKSVLMGGEPAVSTTIHFGFYKREVELLKARQFDRLWWLCVKFAKSQYSKNRGKKNE